MAKVMMRVSGFYEDEPLPVNEVATVDREYAKRVVLLGHADLVLNGDVVDFATACEFLRAEPREIAAWSDIRQAALAEREG